MKKILFLVPLFALVSCIGSKVDAESYFSAYEDAANALKTAKSVSLSSNATSLKASMVDDEGAALEISTTPLAFTLRSDDIAAKSIDSASLSFTMPNANSNLNKVTISGAYLKKITKVFSGGSISCDVNLYANGGNAYVDFKSSSMVRTILSEALVNAGYPKIQSNTNKLVFDQDSKAKVDEYLPLTQYFDDATSSRLKMFRDVYASTPDSFSFGDGENGAKTIAFSSKDKEKTKSIVKDLVKEEEWSKNIDQYFSYCESLSLEYSVTFDASGLKSSAFSVSLSGFDKDAIVKDNPEAKLFPTGTWKIATKIDFAYPTDSIQFPNFGSYREYVFQKAA